MRPGDSGISSTVWWKGCEMTSDEFWEIREAWMELRTIYDGIETMSEEETSGSETDLFGAYAPMAASAR